MTQVSRKRGEPHKKMEEDKEGIKSCKTSIRLRLAKRVCGVKGNDYPPIENVCVP